MSKSLFTGAHKHLVDALTTARKKAKLTQAELGQRVGKNQRFISLIECSQRRVDVLEFYALAKALNVSPLKLYAAVVERLPEKVEI